MSTWARLLLRAVAPREQIDDVLGDLEEAHARRLQHRRRVAARLLTTIETIEMAIALVRGRFARFRVNKGSTMIQDYKLGVRMLVKFPGLTLAGGLALALAIGLGAGWYDVTSDFWRPRMPLPGGDRIIEIEMRNSLGTGDERRIAHDFINWRRHATLVEELGAYRTLERNLVVGDARPEPTLLAETTASAFRLARVAPVLGRPILEADEQPGATPVAVIGYSLWQHRFGGLHSVVGSTVRLGRTATTVVGVMPEGFTFPINHQMWVPLPLQSTYAPLEGPPIRVIARVAGGATQEQAYAEISALTAHVAAASPRTHQNLRPRILAYGGESPGDRPWLELMITHLPILLVLVIACVNVGTLIYARTATREAEIAMRYALGASRWRIISQLFVESWVLAFVAAIVGLTAAHVALRWGVPAYYAGSSAGMPFWVKPGLKPATVLFAGGLTVLGAALLSLLPAIKVTGTRVQSQLRNLGAGGSTLKFGGVWTAAMIAQVALTVICLPPAYGISEEAWRDRIIRDRFPAEEYLAAVIGLDHGTASVEEQAAYRAKFASLYHELERRVAQEPGVTAVTFGDRLPGMGVSVRPGEVDVDATPGAKPLFIPNPWRATVGPNYFEAFDVPVVAGRSFHDGDRADSAHTVIVNEAFSRRYFDGGSPVGHRVRYAANEGAPEEPWLEIVGMVRDIGMTPTDLGEAPYVFHPASLESTSPLVMGVRTSGDPVALAARLRTIAAALESDLRLDQVRTLEDLVWREDVPMMVSAGAIVGVVTLGLFMSAAGIFSLMSVSVARRTREIGLRAALGATRGRLLAGVFAKAAVLIGSGITAGNAVLLLVVVLSDEVDVAFIVGPLVMTSTVMSVVGFLACVEPARRALRIAPTEALKET